MQSNIRIHVQTIIFSHLFRTALSRKKTNPWGLRSILRWIRDRYGNPPLFVTENGVGDDGTLHDKVRLDYFNKYINEMLKGNCC